MSDHQPAPPSDRDEELLQRLRELARERDPLPEHLMAALSGLAAGRDGSSDPGPVNV